MLKKNIEYWAIEVSVSEFSSNIVEEFDTFEEAEDSVMNYADWYCNKGCCKVLHFETKAGRVQETERTRFWEGRRSN